MSFAYVFPGKKGDNVAHIDRAIAQNLALLFSTVSGIRDGQSDAIHDARVATRRLRAALPIAWAGSPVTTWRETAETIRRFGRDLGRVREVDVALEQLPALEARVPTAGASIAILRQELARQQADKHRRLIKTLEQLLLERIQPTQVVPAPALSLLADRRWPFVERVIVEHADSLHAAIVHASGVYFPNRAHRVRVETKKLRYILELTSHAAPARAAVKRLKRLQEILGHLHDQQVLVDTVDSAKGIGGDRRLMVASLRGACDELFQQYLTRRESLLDVCRQVRTAALLGEWRPVTVAEVLWKAGAVAVPPLVLWLTRPRRPATTPADRPAAAVGHVDAFRHSSTERVGVK